MLFQLGTINSGALSLYNLYVEQVGPRVEKTCVTAIEVAILMMP